MAYKTENRVALIGQPGFSFFLPPAIYEGMFYLRTGIFSEANKHFAVKHPFINL